MIIISQDKTQILNFNNIQNIRIEPYGTHIKGKKIYKIFAGNFEGYATEVGTYGKEEKAKEVLQEIIREYKDCNQCDYTAGFGYVINNIYEMPEDKEE